MSNEGDDHEEAYKLLQQAVTFSFASDEMLREIAKLMKKETVEDGHVFVKQGALQTHWYILDKGCVGRFKQADDGLKSLDADGRSEETKNDDEKKKPPHRQKSAQYHKSQTLLDKLEGQGRVTALFHSLNPNHTSFSTLVAIGEVQLWSVDAEQYRDFLSKHAQFCLLLTSHLANLLRKESKVSRALAQSSRMRGGTDAGDLEEGQKLIKVLCYDSTSWVKNGFTPAIAALEDPDVKIQMDFTEQRLDSRSAAYATGYSAICTFVNDTADEDTIRMLSMLGCTCICQRAAGFDRIDVQAAKTFGLTVARVPAYSPYAVAEMGIALLMALNRKITRASSRVKMANFSLDEGLIGYDIHGYVHA